MKRSLCRPASSSSTCRWRRASLSRRCSLVRLCSRGCSSSICLWWDLTFLAATAGWGSLKHAILIRRIPNKATDSVGMESWSRNKDYDYKGVNIAPAELDLRATYEAIVGPEATRIEAGSRRNAAAPTVDEVVCMLFNLDTWGFPPSLGVLESASD